MIEKDRDIKWRKIERNGEVKRLAPESCVVSMEAWAQRATGHKELGAGVVVAVRVHSIGEGVDVGEVAPPRLVVIKPALPCSEFQDALSWALPVPAGWTHGVI